MKDKKFIESLEDRLLESKIWSTRLGELIHIEEFDKLTLKKNLMFLKALSPVSECIIGNLKYSKGHIDSWIDIFEAELKVRNGKYNETV